MQNVTTVASTVPVTRLTYLTQGNVCYTFRHNPLATATRVTKIANVTPLSSESEMVRQVTTPETTAAQAESVATAPSPPKKAKMDDAVFLTPLPIITYTKPPTRIAQHEKPKPRPSNPNQNQLIKALLAQKSTPGPYVARPHAPRSTTSFIIRASTKSPSGKTQILNLPVNVSTPVSIVRNVSQVGPVRPTLTHNLVVKEVAQRPVCRSAFVKTSAGADFTARKPPALATVVSTHATTTMAITTPMTMASPVSYSISPIITTKGTGAVVTTTVSSTPQKPFIFTSTASPKTRTKCFPTYTKTYIPVPHIRAPNKNASPSKAAAPTAIAVPKANNKNANPAKTPALTAFTIPKTRNKDANAAKTAALTAFSVSKAQNKNASAAKTATLTAFTIPKTHDKDSSAAKMAAPTAFAVSKTHNLVASRAIPGGPIKRTVIPPGVTMLGPGGVVTTFAPTIIHRGNAHTNVTPGYKTKYLEPGEIPQLRKTPPPRTFLGPRSVSAAQRQAAEEALQEAATQRESLQEATERVAKHAEHHEESQAGHLEEKRAVLHATSLAALQAASHAQLEAASQNRLKAALTKKRTTAKKHIQITSLAQLQSVALAQPQGTLNVQLLTASQAQLLASSKMQLLATSQAQPQATSQEQPHSLSQMQILATSQTQLQEDTPIQFDSTSQEVPQAQFQEVSEAQFKEVSEAQFQEISQTQFQEITPAQFQELSKGQFQPFPQAPQQSTSQFQEVSQAQILTTSQPQLQATPQAQFQVVSQSQLQAISQAQLLTNPQAQIHSVALAHHQTGHVQPSPRTHHRLIIRSAAASASGAERIITTPATLQSIPDSAVTVPNLQSEQLPSTSLQGSVDGSTSSIHTTTTLTLSTGTTLIMPHYKTTVFKNLSTIARSDSTPTTTDAAAVTERVVIRRPVAYFSARRTFPTQGSGTGPPVNVQRHIIRTIPRHILGTHLQAPVAHVQPSVPRMPQVISTSSSELPGFTTLSQSKPQSSDKNNK